MEAISSNTYAVLEHGGRCTYCNGTEQPHESSGIHPIHLRSLISLIRPDPATFSDAQLNPVALESSEPLGSSLGPVAAPVVSSETKWYPFAMTHLHYEYTDKFQANLPG